MQIANAAQTQDQDTAKTEKSGGGGEVTHNVRHSHVSTHVSSNVSKDVSSHVSEDVSSPKDMSSHVSPHPHEVRLSVLANRLLHGSYCFLVLDLLFTARWGWADLYAMFGNCTVQYTVECDEAPKHFF